MVDYSADMKKIAEMIRGVTKRVAAFGLAVIAEKWEYYEQYLLDRIMGAKKFRMPG